MTLRGSNTMQAFWECELTDGQVMTQYDVDGNETLFGAIPLDEVSRFFVFHDKGSIAVDLNGGILKKSPVLSNGNFSSNYETVYTDVSNKDVVYRLVYFVRNRVTFGTGNVVQSATKTWHVGFQVTIDGKNYKRMLSVGDNGIEQISL